MFFKKQIKISEKFGSDYVENVIEFLKKYFSISYQGLNEVEMDLVYFNYIIDGSEITFVSEGMDGTSILGKSAIVKRILKLVENENPELFESLMN